MKILQAYVWRILLAVAGTLAVLQPTKALDLPSDLPLLDYQAILYPFVAEREFAKPDLNWKRDKSWRDTGPFILKTSYGVHPAVRIYYSPEIIDWLVGGRKGEIPDGAMIVKEMASPPAARYNEYRAKLESQHGNDPAKVEAEMLAYLKKDNNLNWTVMVRDSKAAHNGWFFASVSQSAQIDTFKPPFSPASGQIGDGLCMRCHASAEVELTFSDLDNVAGFPGEPLIFRVDESWRDLTDFPKGPFNLPVEQRPGFGESEAQLVEDFFHSRMQVRAGDISATVSDAKPNPVFTKMFPPKDGIAVDHSQLQQMPSEWLDAVPARPNDRQHFLTSGNCVGCHGGLGGPPSGTTMFLQTGPDYGEGYDISEYGEWRWSPMGLAGRDPIFYAQLESEFELLKQAGVEDLTGNLGTTCLSCHGAMGQRQLEIDAHADPDKGLDSNTFKVDYTLLHAPLTEVEKKQQEADGTFPYHQYGNLAREGISCAVCHHISPPQQTRAQPDYNRLNTYLMNGTTGVFQLTPADQLSGPYSDVRQKPMENAMGILPVHNPYIKDSELCGACHTINLPNVDADPNKPLPGFSEAEQKVFNEASANGAALLNKQYGVTYPEPLTKFQHSVEQATYLEWVNSIYSEEATKTSCQNCHMKTGFESVDGKLKVDAITTQIASIQDSNLPEVGNSLPHDEVNVPFHEGYHRHNFVGLNAFMVKMLSQFRNEMGLSKQSPMTYAENGAQLTMDTMALQARNETADVSLTLENDGVDGLLTAHVVVTNKTGHRLPSGVGFRRAFLEVKAVDADGEVLWCSGCADEVGVIIGENGQPLKTEFLDDVPPGKTEALYQPHHQIIETEDQVQIYEELTQNAKLEFTTSFVHRVHHPKDNRLMPLGALEPGSDAFLTKFGESIETSAFLKATMPEGQATKDSDFKPGSDRTTYKIPLQVSGKNECVNVSATLYYQAIPPYYLKQRFDTAPTGAATQRLYYFASRLETKGTIIEDWKLKVQSDEAQISKNASCK